MTSPAELLRRDFVPTRLSFRWWNAWRKTEPGILERMADAVEADRESLTAKKAIYNGDLPPLRAINRLRTEVRESWLAQTLPYPEDGVRLLPRSRLDQFNAQMARHAEVLEARARDVQAARDQIVAEARGRLREAFSEGNYPTDLSRLYGLEVSYPSIHPAGELPAHVYEQQTRLVQAKVEEAVALGTQALLVQFRDLVEALHERLTPGPDGRKKVFRDSAVNNLREFFDRFRALNLGANPDLDALVAQATDLLSDWQPRELRRQDEVRQELADGLARIGQDLAPLVVTAPRRRILRPAEPAVPASPPTLEPATQE